VKALALAAAKRDKLVPDLPTTAEAGLPGFEITGWYGIFAPTGTPTPIVQKLSAELAKALQASETLVAMDKLGVSVLGGTAEQFADHLKREDAKWSKAIKENNIKLE